VSGQVSKKRRSKKKQKTLEWIGTSHWIVWPLISFLLLYIGEVCVYTCLLSICIESARDIAYTSKRAI
jgi:hypothetical protein